MLASATSLFKEVGTVLLCTKANQGRLVVVSKTIGCSKEEELKQQEKRIAVFGSRGLLSDQFINFFPEHPCKLMSVSVI